MLDHIRIGTRKSPLALIQAEIVKSRLIAAFPGITVEFVPMVTSGDKNVDRSLADIGGKGLFTKELEEGLLNGRIDIAAHSLKDMETFLPQGLSIAAMLEREDPRDVMVSPKANSLAALAKGASIGTSSMRRAALLKIIRPDFNIVPLRGNVATRIAKVERGEMDAAILALAGLKRLGIEDKAAQILSTEEFIPAAGQGAIAIECLEKNADLREMMQNINHYPTYIAGICERSMLATLDGSCRTPIAGYARFEGSLLRIDALVASEDGAKHVKATRKGTPESAVILGHEIALELLDNGGRECLKR